MRNPPTRSRRCHKFCATHALVSDGLAVEVKPLWKEGPGRIARFDVILLVPDTIPAMHHAAIEEVARTCPVHNTLTHAPVITVELQDLVTAGSSGWNRWGNEVCAVTRPARRSAHQAGERQ